MFVGAFFFICNHDRREHLDGGGHRITGPGGPDPGEQRRPCQDTGAS